MKNSKLSVIAAVLSTVVLLTACSGNGNSNTGGNTNTGKSSNEASSNSTTTNNSQQSVDIDPFGKYDPPITIDVAKASSANMRFGDGEDINNNVWQREYEERLGIKLNYVFASVFEGGAYDQKLNLSIASGDLPDIFQVNAQQLKQLVAAGQVEDLTEVFDQYTSEYTKSLYEDAGDSALLSATFEGKLYAIPALASSLDTAPVMYVRKDWREKLGLPEPKTMQDVIAMAEAFTNGDPDGNGVKDTYGIAFTKDAVVGTGFADLQGFMNGYHAYLNTWIEDASGNLVYGPIQPEVKQALQQLQDLYKAGAIDREFATKDMTKVGEDLSKIGIQFGQMWNPIMPMQGSVLSNPGSDWEPFSIVSIDDKPALASVVAPVVKYLVVRKGYEHPEAAIKINNLTYENLQGPNADYEKFGTNLDGQEGLHYTLMIAEPPLKNNTIYLKVNEALKTGDDSKLNSEMKITLGDITAYNNGDMNKWAGAKIFGPDSSQAVLNQYQLDGRIMPNSFYGGATDSMADKNASLEKLMVEVFTKIIMGDPIDNFDKFVEDWKKLGGDTITQEVNEWRAGLKG